MFSRFNEGLSKAFHSRLESGPPSATPDASGGTRPDTPHASLFFVQMGQTGPVVNIGEAECPFYSFGSVSALN